ncbi:MAG: nucleotidyl transferase AbiEii/AbiGii toxin family protein [Verrucomicrobia bacterium]|nr:nucleotidyl transferase AbiEii/AbiGii toxin family protein [Verrucomicrobiota bacterium]MDA1088524.1 nucleotidyl transferase AbiEii/AbiGii toxin family protein [Verrucomicrobiota bacterium]
MHEKVLPQHSLDLLSELEANPSPSLSGWTLAGGTGLAFHLGHRTSEDLDFFRTDDEDVRLLHDVLSQRGSYETLQEAEHTLTVLIRETKLSFFRVRDPFLFEAVPYRFFSIADARDIALMKLAAISGRGSRKDFADLYIILQSDSTLESYFDLLPRKYDASRLNTYHILKSLTYFEDAEAEPMPEMLVPFDWEECKAFFVRQARAIVLQ